VCLCVVCLQFARTGVFCLKKNDRPFGQKHRKTVRCGGASLKAIDIRMGAPPTEYLASSTKVRDDVCDVMLGAYALARHGNRGAGHACVCVCVCVDKNLLCWPRVTSEPCTQDWSVLCSRFAARVGRLLRA
jgi:hypothetical protein